MKKILTLFIVLTGLQNAVALPIGNPSEVTLFRCALPFKERCLCFLDQFRFSVGYYGDFVFNRHLETVTERQIDYSTLTTNAAYLALNFRNLFEIFSTLGATKIKFNTSFSPFNAEGDNPRPRFDFESTTAFSWSLGGRGTLYEYRHFALGIEGQYFSTETQGKVLFLRTNVNDYPSESSTRRYSEWQVGTGISWRYNPYFVPYAAIKYSRAFWDFDNQLFSITGTQAVIPSIRSAKNWGYAVGLTFAPFNCHDLALTVEGRFADEAALYVNAFLHF